MAFRAAARARAAGSKCQSVRVAGRWISNQRQGVASWALATLTQTSLNIRPFCDITLSGAAADMAVWDLPLVKGLDLRAPCKQAHVSALALSRQLFAIFRQSERKIG